MPVVAVINRKGGSGKSTLATHLAAYLARQGLPVMLGDADRSQSTQVWLRLRAQNLPGTGAQILGRHIDPRNLLRPPAGTDHVVLDTPGGLHGFELARMVCHAHAVILPVCNSVFDRDSAAGCWAELKAHPRVVSGRCRVAAIGMRLDARTRANRVLRDWAQGIGLPFLGVLRETQAYVRCVENGLTLFDMPPSVVANDLAQWAPILDWLKPVLHPEAESAARVADGALRPTYKPFECPPPQSSGLVDSQGLDQRATQGFTIPGALTELPSAPPVRARVVAPARAEVSGSKVPARLQLGRVPTWGERIGKVLGAMPLRRFLDRGT